MPGHDDGSVQSALPPPPCIDDFDVGQELGRGGFAVVYRARVRASGREVALKVVDKSRACEQLSSTSAGDGVELACAKVANEVRLHWGLKHPTVVEMLDFFEDDRFVYLVLELCKGGDLHRKLRRGGPLGEREAAGYMGQLLAGLAYLHERGVMHRDLKLSNLLLSEDGRRLRIADFGLAVKLEDADHERHTICGTPNYMAPEVQGQGYGLSADLWSAGCLFYTMVTGFAPFQGSLVGDTLANARAGRYVEPEGLSTLAKDFLSSMLSLDPNRRLRVDEATSHPFLRLDNHTKDVCEKPKVRDVRGKHRSSVPPPSSAEAIKQKDEQGRYVYIAGKRGSKGHTRMTSDARGKLGAQASASLVYKDHAGGGANGSVSGAATGYSTLTASTTVLGSGLCSANSSMLMGRGEADSSMTLRAEAVPTPSKIGRGAAAAAARVRRVAASVRGPFPEATEDATVWKGKTMGGEDKAGLRRVVNTDTATKMSSQRTLREGCSEAFMEGKGSDQDRSTAPCTERKSGMRRSGGAIGSKRRESERQSLGSRSAYVRDTTGAKSGKVFPVHKDSSSLLSERAPAMGDGAQVYTDRRRDDKNTFSRVAACRNADRRDRDSVDANAASSKIQSPGKPHYDEVEGSKVRLAWSNADDDQKRVQRRRQRPQPTRDLCSKQNQALTGSIADTFRPRKQGWNVGVVGGREGYSSDDSLSPTSENTNRVSSRRRRRRDVSSAAARPPPPLPPQPPPPLPPQPPPLVVEDERAHPIRPHRQHELREMRVVAEARRRLHEACCPPSSTVSPAVAAGHSRPMSNSVDILIPLFTGRVKPVSHSLGGRAAVEVYENGHASIAVGKRWLVTSPNGERVWTGSVGTRGCSSSEVSASATAGGRHGPGVDALNTAAAAASVVAARAETAEARYTLRTLPEGLRPLYKSLAGIVDALRSKTPKLALRRERTDAGAKSLDGGHERGPACATAEVVVCALMENLPDPDFVATFDDGASISLSNRKNQLRVELPNGGVSTWSNNPEKEWSECSLVSESHVGHGGDTLCPRTDSGAAARSQERGGKSRIVRTEEYIRAGLDAYCRCLREEIAAYERGKSFPMEIVVAAAGERTCSPESEMANAGGRYQVERVLEDKGGDSAPMTTAKSPSGGDMDGAHVPRVRCRDRPPGGDAGAVRRQWRGDDDSSTSSTGVKEQAQSRAYLHGNNPGASGHLKHPGVESGHDRLQTAGDVWRDVRADRPPPLASPREIRVAPGKRSASSARRMSPSPLLHSASTVQSPLGGTAETMRPSSRYRGNVAVVARARKNSGSDYNKLPKDEPSPETHSLSYSPTTSEDRRVRHPERSATLRDNSGGGGDNVKDGRAKDRDSERPATLRDGNGGGDNVKDSRAKDRDSDRRARRSAVAVIPGLGEASRDELGNLEVRFYDGVLVKVDAHAKWMRVEHLTSQRRDSHVKESIRKLVTYDLGRRSGSGRGGGDGGDGVDRKPRERMPRDVKERMKTLPEFINALRRTPVAGRREEEEAHRPAGSSRSSRARDRR